MIARKISTQIRSQVGKYPVITITGPRQSGKTTLIKTLFPSLPYFSLEDPDVRALVEQDPRGFLNQYGHRLVLDEVQQLPILLSYIQGIVDSDREALFILSGSHNMLMMESVTQTLAGRTSIFYLQPLSYEELRREVSPSITALELAWRGGYPRIYDRDLDVERFYRDYLTTYVQRDVRLVKNVGNLDAFTQFLGICAGFIGQTLNKNSLADAAGVTRVTVDAWLSVLRTTFVTYHLPPYFRNFKKRLVKSPKLYFRDTGLACALLGLTSPQTLFTYYQRGAIMENFVINEVAKAFYNRGDHPAMYFWRDSNQHEIDLLIDRDGLLTPIEIKSGSTFRQDFFKQLNWFESVANVPLGEPAVVYGGDQNQYLNRKRLLSWRSCASIVYSDDVSSDS